MKTQTIWSFQAKLPLFHPALQLPIVQPVCTSHQLQASDPHAAPTQGHTSDPAHQAEGKGQFKLECVFQRLKMLKLKAGS